MSWMVRRQFWRTSFWIRAPVSGIVQLLVLSVCSSSSTDVRPILNWACYWNTCVRFKLLYPKACWIIVRVSVALLTRLAQKLLYTRCSFLRSVVKFAAGHVHDSKQTRVETAQVHPTTCNLAHWLTRQCSPTIYRCFALLKLQYRWRHQSRKFWIPSRIGDFVSPVLCSGWSSNIVEY
jgi:hypothetical protein